MTTQNDPISACIPKTKSVNNRRYQKISAVELYKIKTYFNDMDKSQLAQKHGLSEIDYDIVTQKLLFRKNYTEIANQYGWTGEWTRQLFLKVIRQLQGCHIL